MQKMGKRFGIYFTKVRPSPPKKDLCGQTPTIYRLPGSFESNHVVRAQQT